MKIPVLNFPVKKNFETSNLSLFYAKRELKWKPLLGKKQ